MAKFPSDEDLGPPPALDNGILGEIPPGFHSNMPVYDMPEGPTPAARIIGDAGQGEAFADDDLETARFNTLWDLVTLEADRNARAPATLGEAGGTSFPGAGEKGEAGETAQGAAGLAALLSAPSAGADDDPLTGMVTQRDALLQNIANPGLRAFLKQQTDGDIANVRVASNQQAQAAKRAQDLKTLNDLANNIIGQASVNDDENMRARALRNGRQLLQTYVAKGILTPDEAETWNRRFVDSYAEALADARANKGKIDDVLTDIDEADTRAKINPALVIQDKSAAAGFGTRFGPLRNVKGMVIHHTNDRHSVDGVIRTFKGTNFPAQFVIERDGTVYRTIPDGYRGQHVKNGWGPVGKGLSNANTEGVEIVGLNDGDITPAQEAAAIALVQERAAKWGYDPKTSVWGHGQINPGHKEDDEGMTVVNAIRMGAGSNARPAGKSAPDDLFGYKIRTKLYDGEDRYFKVRPDVGGMASESGHIILNPYSPPEVNKEAVAKNEALRLYMRERGIVPDIAITDEQRAAFAGTDYENDDDALKQTIVARIYSGDPSAKATPEQKQAADDLVAQARKETSLPWQGPLKPPTIFDAMDPAAREKLRQRMSGLRDAQRIDQERKTRLERQKALDDSEAMEGRLLDDIYGDKPSITAQDIAQNDFLTPQAKGRMIGLLQRSNRPDPPTAASNDTALDLLDRMRRPEGDPLRISNAQALNDAFIEGKLNRNDVQMLRKEWGEMRSPEGQRLAARKSDLLENVKAAIDRSNPLTCLRDPGGRQQFYNFQFDLNRKIEAYREAGKDPGDLFDPSKPDFMGKPEAVAPYQRTLQQWIRDQLRQLTAPKADGAAQSPVVPREEGETIDNYLKRTGKQ